MIASFRNWYYGEDGTNPLFRLKKMHKICLLVLLGSVLFSIFGPVYDNPVLQVYSTAIYFTFFFCTGFGVRLLGPHWDIVIHMNRGGNALFVIVLSIIISIFIAWLVLPLYLLLFAADFRYRCRVGRTNPQLLEEMKPSYKDLSDV